MKKNLLLILCVFVTNTVFAKPIPFIAKQLNKMKASHQHVPQSNGVFQHTDFTGHWISQCQDMDDMTIENDEEAISIDGKEMAIGAINHLGMNSKQMTISYTLLPEWTDQGESLHLTINAYSVELLDDEGNSASDFFAMVGTGKMRLRNNKLYMNMKSSLFLNGSKMTEENINCSFVKSP